MNWYIPSMAVAVVCVLIVMVTLLVLTVCTIRAHVMNSRIRRAMRNPSRFREDRGSATLSTNTVGNQLIDRYQKHPISPPPPRKVYRDSKGRKIGRKPPPPSAPPPPPGQTIYLHTEELTVEEIHMMAQGMEVMKVEEIRVTTGQCYDASSILDRRFDELKEALEDKNNWVQDKEIRGESFNDTHFDEVSNAIPPTEAERPVEAEVEAPDPDASWDDSANRDSSVGEADTSSSNDTSPEGCDSSDSYSDDTSSSDD